MIRCQPWKSRRQKVPDGGNLECKGLEEGRSLTGWKKASVSQRRRNEEVRGVWG